jgi:hypothetical protein
MSHYHKLTYPVISGFYWWYDNAPKGTMFHGVQHRTPEPCHIKECGDGHFYITSTGHINLTLEVFFRWYPDAVFSHRMIPPPHQHVVDALKDIGIQMTPEAEKGMRAICDEKVDVTTMEDIPKGSRVYACTSIMAEDESLEDPEGYGNRRQDPEPFQDQGEPGPGV